MNHLVDTSFAGSAMRTTEGVWMAVTPTDDMLIVALDFEGEYGFILVSFRTDWKPILQACIVSSVQHKKTASWFSSIPLSQILLVYPAISNVSELIHVLSGSLS